MRRTSFASALSTLALSALATTVFAVPAAASDLAAFLERTERMATHNQPVRADVEIELPDGNKTKAVIVIDGEAGKLFFARADNEWRGLVPLSWEGSGKTVAASGAKAESARANTRLGDTDIRALSFFPFWGVADYTTAFISDNQLKEKTVTLYAPKTVPYELFVLTFSKEQMVPVTIRYYTEQFNHLERLRNDSEHVMVGSRLRPQKIVISNFDDNTKTTYSLKWQILEELPEGLMTESGFSTKTIDF